MFAKATLTALIVSQIAFLALRTQDPHFQTSASVAADVLSFVATIVASLLSVLTHQRSPRPSTLLSLYLSASIVLGVARVRTLWLLGKGAPVPAVLTLSFVFTIAAIVLESIASKKMAPDDKYATPEQRSGFWARTCFFWLAQTFSAGYRKVISLSDLPGLDPSLESSLLHKDLAIAWDKCKSRESQPGKCLHGETFANRWLFQMTIVAAAVCFELAFEAISFLSWRLSFPDCV